MESYRCYSFFFQDCVYIFDSELIDLDFMILVSTSIKIDASLNSEAAH